MVVVEDEPDVLELLHDVLETEGYPVLGVGQPDLVVSLIGSVTPSLFLIDLMLPRMSGIELAEQLRANGFKDTPMVAMSASRLMLEVADKSGLFQASISKPFDLTTVLDCVGRYQKPGS